ncbi:hypothetical protein TRFO_40182 [Tritrichomonas foetus]|uniref:Myb-like DNA-binding domain containing protein n=1 Tax=Tritrichomonas foetus TaxID=1144522 RepID=A0A1J4J4B6_9EUKA|nr:hypothetical protein TRFO_40182 [Tritrichomonas foetus]|eukprot:OHS93569.1 hypothetical protein TRFO_40182 [Tritrichomonas foetus]
MKPSSSANILGTHTVTPGARKGRRPFTPEEDATLASIVAQGVKGWGKVAANLPGRTARQCRERWVGYLDPTIKYEPWSEHEDLLLLDLIQKNGHRWTLISKAFSGRTDNDVKNRWYTHLKDAAFTTQDGALRILRDHNGNIISNKKKRKRKIVCANQNALQAVSAKQQLDDDSSPHAVEGKVYEVETTSLKAGLSGNSLSITSLPSTIEKPINSISSQAIKNPPLNLQINHSINSSNQNPNSQRNNSLDSQFLTDNSPNSINNSLIDTIKAHVEPQVNKMTNPINAPLSAALNSSLGSNLSSTAINSRSISPLRSKTSGIHLPPKIEAFSIGANASALSDIHPISSLLPSMGTNSNHSMNVSEVGQSSEKLLVSTATNTTSETFQEKPSSDVADHEINHAILPSITVLPAVLDPLTLPVAVKPTVVTVPVVDGPAAISPSVVPLVAKPVARVQQAFPKLEPLGQLPCMKFIEFIQNHDKPK